MSATATELTTEDLYGPLTVVRERLDQRTTEYAFDLEADMPWDRLDEPGLYVPAPLLDLFGIDVQTLAAHREAYETFQWATALSICRTFQLLERGVIKFCDGESDRLGTTTSIGRLCEEEDKHIRLFRRIATHLLSQRPELKADFNESFGDTFRFLRGVYEVENTDQLHLKIWMTSLFFEPATLHLADELEAADEPMQPAWLVANQLHAQEEQQHIATVGAYASQLQVDGAARDAVVADFIEEFSSGFQQLHGTATPLALIKKRWPELDVAPSPDSIPEPFVEEIAYSNHFKPLRRIVPDLADRIRSAPASASSLPPTRHVLVISDDGSDAAQLAEVLSGHAGPTVAIASAAMSKVPEVAQANGNEVRYICLSQDRQPAAAQNLAGVVPGLDAAQHTDTAASDLAQTPTTEIARLCAFLGFTYSDATID